MNKAGDKDEKKSKKHGIRKNKPQGKTNTRQTAKEKIGGKTK